MTKDSKQKRRQRSRSVHYQVLERRQLLAGIVAGSELTPIGESSRGIGFGENVDVSGDFAVASGQRPSTAQAELLRPEDNFVQVFRRLEGAAGEPDSWVPFQELTSTATSGGFGWEVAISGNNLVVGSTDQVEVFEFDGQAWVLDQTITGLSRDNFSGDVELSDDYLFVGSELDPFGGAIQVYEKVSGSWTLTDQIESTSSFFGMEISAEDDFVAAGVNGDTAVYRRDAATGLWAEDLLVEDAVFFDLGGGDRLAVATGFSNSSLEVLARDSSGVWQQEFQRSVTRIGDVSLDGDVLSMTPFNDQQLYRRDRGTGQWEQFVVPEVDTFLHDRAEVDGNTLIRGFPSQEGSGPVSGAVDIYDISPGFNATKLLDDYAPPSSITEDVVAGEAFGAQTVIGDDFIAVSATYDYVRSGLRPGKIYIYARNDNGTADTVDDTYERVQALTGDFGLGFQMAAQGDELYALDLNGIRAYQFDGSQMVEQELITGSAVQSSVSNLSSQKMEIDGDRMVVLTNQRMVFTLERTNGEWAEVDRFQPDPTSVTALSLSGDTLALTYSGFNSTTTTGPVVYTRGASGWDLQQELVMPPSGTLGARHVVIEGDRLFSPTNNDLVVFERANDVWTQTDVIQGGNGTVFDVEGDVLVSYSNTFDRDDYTLNVWGYNDVDGWVLSDSIQAPNGEDVVFPSVKINENHVALTSNGTFGFARSFNFVNQAVTASDTQLEVAEDAANGFLLGKVIADDADAEDTPVVSIVSGNEDGVFAVDSDGNVTVADASLLDHETTSEYELVFEATDGSTTATALLTIVVTNVNEDATITGDLSGDGFEGDAAITGVVTVNDPDGAAESQVVAQSGTDGSYGVFSIDASGNWSYAIDSAAVEFLGPSESVFEMFVIASVDGTAAEFIAVTVTGIDDSVDVTIPGVIDDIEDLVDEGILGNGQANPVINFLDQAQKDIDKGKISKAISKLEEARERIQDLFDDGDLSAEDAEPILDAIDQLLDSLLEV